MDGAFQGNWAVTQTKWPLDVQKIRSKVLLALILGDNHGYCILDILFLVSSLSGFALSDRLIQVGDNGKKVVGTQ